MKKIFAILMAIFLLASSFSISVFAEDTKICNVSGLKADGTVELIAHYNFFSNGWNNAVDYATNRSWMKQNGYDRIIIDFYLDWKADDGFFWNEGKGFKSQTLYVPAGAMLTINLNGHTINRNMSDWDWNGEVILIDEDSDVIINNGTIKGGWSGNGAGGIHVLDNVKLTLNDVHVDGNTADDDNGAAIAIHENATLIMNGGSLSNNKMIGTHGGEVDKGGAIYAYKSIVKLDGVEIKNNKTFNDETAGMAIYAEESEVTLTNCIIDGNGIKTDEEDIEHAFATIHLNNSMLTATKTKFTGNGSYLCGDYSRYSGSSIIRMQNSSSVTLDDCDFENNNVWTLFHIISVNKDSALYANKCDFVNNNSSVYYGGTTSVFKECTFSNNKPHDIDRVFENDDTSHITFIDCSMDDSTYEDEEYINFEYPNISKEDAVIGVSVVFADGSISFSQYYKSLADGWDDAIEHAKSASGYDRVIVDLYKDWKTQDEPTSDGRVIYIPSNTRITLNLNGHTIYRKISGEFAPYDGEVICVESNADFILNDGTIKGGFSCDGAGGIHIKSNAKVVLNNVNLVQNHSEGSNGSSIAVRSGAALVMNGGSITGCRMHTGYIEFIPAITPHGTIYADEATVTLNKVVMDDNYSKDDDATGAAICADDSTVTLNECTISNSGYGTESVIAASDSKLIINKTDFTGNHENGELPYLFYLEDSSLTMDGGNITGNNADLLFHFENSKADIKGVNITDNTSKVIHVNNTTEKVNLTECTLGNNTPSENIVDISVAENGTLTITDCALGDTSFEDKAKVSGVGSMIGEGSISNILSIISIVASAIAVASVIVLKYKTDKKKS